MMKLNSNGSAASGAVPVVSSVSSLAPTSAIQSVDSQPFLSDFMGNQLATYFSQLFEQGQGEASGQRKEKKKCKKCKKSSIKSKDSRKVDVLPDFQPTLSQVSIPRNPSPFAVFAAVRATCLENRRRQTALLQLQLASQWKENEEGDSVDCAIEDDTDKKLALPKIIGIGLHAVFEIIRECRVKYPEVCRRAIASLLDILQGHLPEQLSKEPCNVMDPMFDILLELASSDISNSNVELQATGKSIRSLACASLLSLSVAYGDTGKLLVAASSMLMSPKGFENIIMPGILVGLQRSVLSVMLGHTDHPDFMTCGVPTNSMIDSFSIKFRNSPSKTYSLSSDGAYIYLLTNRGLYKVGSGFAGSIKGHIYCHQTSLSSEDGGWLGYARGHLYYLVNRYAGSCKSDYDGVLCAGDSTNISLAVQVIDTDKLAILRSLKICDVPLRHPDSPYVTFTDGSHIGIVTTNLSDDNFMARFYASDEDPDVDTLTCVNEFPLKLARKCIEVLGASLQENSITAAGPMAVVAPLAQAVQPSINDKKYQVDFGCDDEMMTIQSGKDFTLLLTSQGCIYYTGKSTSIGYNQAIQANQWHELNMTKSSKITQLSVGHDALHALLLAEDGTVYFVGTAKRGEDGDQSKTRRQPKAVKPKKFSRMEGHSVVQIAAGNGTSSMVTKDGDLFVFGKDSSQCDFNTGQVIELKGKTVVEVVVGKAHVVALTKEGDVYTFGMNNKGQCGRDFPLSRDAYTAGTSTSVPPTASSIPVIQSTDGLDDFGSDPDVDLDQEGGPANDGICPMGKHSWKNDQCMVCVLCGECTGYGASCVSSGRPDRNPGTLCGCGTGDSGCAECGCCRLCVGEGGDLVASAVAIDAEWLPPREYFIPGNLPPDFPRTPIHHEYREKLMRRRLQRIGSCRRSRRFAERDKREPRRDDEYMKTILGPRNNGMRARFMTKTASSGDLDKEAVTANSGGGGSSSGKLATLPPAKISLPKKVKIVKLSSGLHHTLMLSSEGEVFGFGSNTYGQLGQTDLISRGTPTLISLPKKAVSVAAGGHHSVILVEDGQVYTFGNHTKGQLGRPQPGSESASSSSDTAGQKAMKELWFAVPEAIPNVGSHFGRSATWIGASADQTFLKIDESLINVQSLSASTVVANSRHIMVLPKQNLIKIGNSSQGTQVSTASFSCLSISRNDGFCRSFFSDDQMHFKQHHVINLDPLYNVLWCYNASDNLMQAYNPLASGLQPDMTDKVTGFPTILSPDLALPLVSGCPISRSQASLNLLSCLDTLSQYPDVSLVTSDEDNVKTLSQKAHTKEDYSVVNRFDSHGGGWGYSGLSVEAIRFMCDTDILLGGFGLFGGRGEYGAKIKLFDIGFEGGDQERDGELLAESDEYAYECGVRQKYPILFDEPIALSANKWYVAWARISGPSSDCGSNGQTQVTTEDQVQFHFKSSKKSNNGTDVNAGQVPQLLYRIITNDIQTTHRRFEPQEPVCILSPKFSRTVSADCFMAPLKLINWAWNAFKAGLRDLQKDDNLCQPTLLDQQRLIFICRACLRLVVTFTEEIYPCRVGTGAKIVPETQKLAESVLQVRTVLQQLLTDPLPKNYSASPSGVSMIRLVMADAHRAYVNCFNAFYPTGYLKWACLCSLLASMEHPSESINYENWLTAVLDSLCNPLIKLRNTFPIAYSPDTETRTCKNLSPSENISITTSMIQASDTWANRFPILTEVMTFSSHLPSVRFSSWSFREVLDRLLALSSQPVKQALKGDTSQLYPPDLVEKACQVVSSVISELANQTLSFDADLHHMGSRILHTTPNRFARTSNSRTWNACNGSPDAICFAVDRPGIYIAGCCVYGGTGTYDYELELLDDQSLVGVPDKDVSAKQSQRWNSLETIQGTYSSDDCLGDIAELKFDRPVPIRPHVKYALRLRNHRGRTSNGDDGVATVKGPDGTNFTFTFCSLSFNGTNPARGQIPSILYFSTPDANSSTSNGLGSANGGNGGGSSVAVNCSSSHLLSSTTANSGAKCLAKMYARRTALSMTSAIVKTVTGLLVQARDSVDDHHSLQVLSNAPIITKLMPNILSSISSLAVTDPQSAVQVLTFIQNMLPSVASLNNLIILNEDLTDEQERDHSSDDIDHHSEDHDPVSSQPSSDGTSQLHHAWVESDHPYKAASVNNYRVLFPPSVRWMSLEFDPRCSTSQQEDVLQIYIRNPVTSKLASTGNPVVFNTSVPVHSHGKEYAFKSAAATAASSVVVAEDIPAQLYRPVLQKFSGPENWPHQSVILPGNEVLFSLETASDYIKDDKNHNFGFRCLVVGYESDTKNENGLRCLEMELAYLGGICAAALMKKNLPLSTTNEDTEEDCELMEESAMESFEMHMALLSRGFALDRPPSVQQALDGVIPFSCHSKERQFLRNFVHCVPNTSGGRLASWMQPDSFVDVDKCLVHLSVEDMRCHWPSMITVVTRDQYEQVVQVPNLRVDVRAVPIQDSNQHGRRSNKTLQMDAMTFGGHRLPNLDTKYEATVKDKVFYHAITVQKAYENYSFEELRYASPKLKRQSESMLVRPNNDGTYTANWTPASVGCYQIHVLIDNCQMPTNLSIEVKDSPYGMAPPNHPGAGHSKDGFQRAYNNRLRKFVAKPSAGLRIRIHPTLQSEQIGVVPVDGTVTIVDELQNSDGMWVRLGQDSLIKYCNTHSTSEGWCLQYNRHLDKTLLIPIIETTKQVDKCLNGQSLSALLESTALASFGATKQKQKRFRPGPGLYVVTKSGASGHNVRSKPSMSAEPIGMLHLRDWFGVKEVRDINGEIWVSLDQEAIDKHCFTVDEDAWTLALSSSDIQYIESLKNLDEQRQQRLDDAVETHAFDSFMRKSGSTTTAADVIGNDAMKPIPPPRQSLRNVKMEQSSSIFSPVATLEGVAVTRQPTPSALRTSVSNASASPTQTSSCNTMDSRRKPSLFQKLFKVDSSSRRSGSQSPPLLSPPPAGPRKVHIPVNKDIPPELQGVSVKELVKVIGESRANGNGVTPPGTPGSQRKASSTRSVSPQISGSSRSSSPGSISYLQASTSMPKAADASVAAPDASASCPSSSKDDHVPRPEAAALDKRKMKDNQIQSLGNSLSHLRSKHSRSTSPAASASTSTSWPSSSSPAKDSLLKVSSSATPAQLGAVKEALSPSVAEAIRSVFAAFIWHEGVVHDAMTLASYLKFHPNLTKTGSVSVVASEEEQHKLPDDKHHTDQKQAHPVLPLHTKLPLSRDQKAKQRHSVEVLATPPSPAKYLTDRSGSAATNSNANANRNVVSASSRNSESSVPENAPFNFQRSLQRMAESGLPPAAAMLVLLWEEIRSYCSHAIRQQIIIASPMNIQPERSQSDLSRRSRKRGWNKKDKRSQVVAVPADDDVTQDSMNQLCDMCASYFLEPVAHHMSISHPGCRGPAGGKGYNSAGKYCSGWAGKCGDGGAGGSTWYLICEKCRDNYIKKIPAKKPDAAQDANEHNRPDVPPSHRHAIPQIMNPLPGIGGALKSTALQRNAASQPAAPFAAHVPSLPSTSGMATSSTAATSSGPQQSSSHSIMKNNAMFLLDLASLAKSSDSNCVEAGSGAVCRRLANLPGNSASELTPLDPNPFPLVPFQCFHALGVRNSHLKLLNDELVLDEALKESPVLADVRSSEAACSPTDEEAKDVKADCASQLPSTSGTSAACLRKVKFGRSVSVGAHVSKEWKAFISQLEQHRKRQSSYEQQQQQQLQQNQHGVSSGGINEDFNPDLLSRPSAALQKLFLSPCSVHSLTEILQRPVMSFVLQWNDLESLQFSMNLSVRKAACRTFAMQALNWLLRSVSQPASLHDLLWCFAAALEANSEQSSGDNSNEKKPPQLQQPAVRKKMPTDSSQLGLFEHPISDVCTGGLATKPLPATFHTLLQTISDLMLMLPMGSSLQQMAITCWGIKFCPSDHYFLHQSHVFSTISRILSRSEELDNAAASNTHASNLSLYECGGTVEKLVDITANMELKVSSRQAMLASLIDNSTETFWEPGDEDRNKAKWITATLRPSDKICLIRCLAIHVDNCRDLSSKVSLVTFKAGCSFEEMQVVKQCDVESRFAGWITCYLDSARPLFIKIEIKGPDSSLRLRQFKALGVMQDQSLVDGPGPALTSDDPAPPDLKGGAAMAEDVLVAPASGHSLEPCAIQQRNCEAETLRVFRLITGRVFGKLLKESWLPNSGHPFDQQADKQRAGGVSEPKQQHEKEEADEEEGEDDDQQQTQGQSGAGSGADDLETETCQVHGWDQEPYLKEHVVGILFSRPKLTHLQRQVCSHIVNVIKKEARRMKEEWESSLSSALPRDANVGASTPDTYCFEMLSLVLALSGSSVGRSHLAGQFGFIKDLLTLLHTGTARIQRQVISLLRRVLPLVPPLSFANALGIHSLPPKDFGILTTVSSAEDTEVFTFNLQRLGILDVFLSCIAKALNLQVKTRIKNSQQGLCKNIWSTCLATSMHPGDQQTDLGSRWWMRGSMSKKIAEDIIQLLKDLTMGKVSEDWAAVTKSAIAENILNLTRIEDTHREHTTCLKLPVLWLALASLCVLDKDHVEALSSGEWNGVNGGASSDAGTAPNVRPTCANHDDGETPAIIVCDQCSNLCADCDRVLHLHRRAKSHQRQVFKEAEDAIKVDLHEGCGRIKLFWIMALADSITLKTMIEFKDGNRSKLSALNLVSAGGSAMSAFKTIGGVAVSSMMSVCRFCCRQSTPQTPIMDGLCPDKECMEYSRIACSKVLGCGHFCGGIANEAECLPCLYGCSGANLRQDADDMCMICFTEALSPIPSVQLKCGHIFHFLCLSMVLQKRWTGPRITFGFTNCPICKSKMQHPALRKLLDPIDTLFEDVKKKALMRLEYEGLSKCEAVSTVGARFYKDPAGFAMDRYAYYVCFKCKKAYYGGEAQCDVEAGIGDDYNPEELVCGGCSDVSRAQMCPKHGTDYLEYKCRYCCSVAVFFCFGTTHFCNACHDDFQRVTNVPKHELPQCPVGPKAIQLDGEECPLHVAHPPTGTEFALGCGICRNAHTF